MSSKTEQKGPPVCWHAIHGRVCVKMVDVALSQNRYSPLVFRASLIVTIHTYLAYAAFITALIIGCLLHYKKIVKNGVAGYPEEWFPSVSAT
jgi:hypothetical protein